MTDEECLSLSLPGMKVLENAHHHFSCEVDIGITPIDRVIQEALKLTALKDITIEDPSMEEVIRLLYGTHPMSKMQKYCTIFRLSFLHTLKNYKALIGLSIFLITCLVIFAHLWKIAAAKTGVVLHSRQLLWYIAFNEWVFVSIPDTQEDMEQDLRSGTFSLSASKAHFLSWERLFAEAAGTLSVNLLILGLVTFLFTWWQVGALPFHPIGLL